MSDKYGQIIKIIIVGKGGVGKTALCCSITGKPVMTTSEYILTVGVDFHTLQLQLDGQLITMQITDLAGQKQFEEILDLFVGGTQGALLAFDITNMESYMALHNVWIPFIKQNITKLPLYLIGTKADLNANREVPLSLVEEFLESEGRELGILGYTETSAVIDSPENMVPFQTLAKAIVQQQE